MCSITKNLLVLEEFSRDGACFRLRYIPVFLNHDVIDPILILSFEPSSSMEAFLKFVNSSKGEIINDVEVDDQILSFWIDGEIEPYSFKGAATWVNEEYQAKDFIRIIEDQSDHIAQQTDEIRKYVQVINRAGLFIEKSIDRLERKAKWKGFFKHNHGAEIRLLKTVRNQLEQDD